MSEQGTVPKTVPGATRDSWPAHGHGSDPSLAGRTVVGVGRYRCARRKSDIVVVYDEFC